MTDKCLMFSVMPSDGIQIINHLNHWTCISTIGCQPGHVDVYDSLYSTLSPSAVQQVFNLLHTKEAKLTVTMRDVQIQSRCGMYRYSQEQVTADCSRLPLPYVCVRAKIRAGSHGHKN